MNKTDKVLEVAMEKVAVFYYVVYYLIGSKLELLPSLKEIGDGAFTHLHIIMMIVYMIVVNLSHLVTCAGVDLFTKEK